ncbi:MAG: hypothetical protein ACM3IH_14095 [Sphingobacteriales bacterium]
MNKLTVSLATRNRPKLLIETLYETLPNIELGTTKVVVGIDEDDKDTIRAINESGLTKGRQVIASIRPREDNRGEKYDRALTEAPADVYLVQGDYTPIVTKGFDKIILEKAALFPDGIGCIHTNYFHRSVFPPGLQAVTQGWVNKVGYIYSHEYPFWFIDHELHDLARLVGRYFPADVDIDTSRKPADTMRLRDVAFWASYYDMMALDRRAKARAMIQSEDFKTPEWLKQGLLDDYHVIETEAWRINESVRHSAADLEARRGDKGPPDEGYLRAKAKAEAKLNELFSTLRQAA